MSMHIPFLHRATKPRDKFHQYLEKIENSEKLFKEFQIWVKRILVNGLNLNDAYHEFYKSVWAWSNNSKSLTIFPRIFNENLLNFVKFHRIGKRHQCLKVKYFIFLISLVTILY